MFKGLVKSIKRKKISWKHNCEVGRIKKRSSATTHHFVKYFTSRVSMQRKTFFSTITRPQDNFYYQPRSPVFTLVMKLWLDFRFPVVMNATSASSAFQRTAVLFMARALYTQPCSKLSCISKMTRMPQPQQVICHLVFFKVGPFHQAESVCTLYINQLLLD